MKSIFESPEVMATYAEIDLCYIQIRMIEERMSSRNGLIRQIDIATGYNNALTLECANDLVEVLRRMIDLKSSIEAPIEHDQIQLAGLLGLIKRMQDKSPE